MDSPEPAKPDEAIDLALDAPEPEAALPPGRPRWHWIAAGTAALVLVFGATVGAVALFNSSRGTADQLRASDPKGAEACESLTLWLEGKVTDPKTGKSFDVITIGSTLAEYAKDSTTPGIKATAGSDISEDPTFKAFGLPSLRFLNPERLHTACVDAGVNMPPYVKPAGA